jgi:hypothetical protein
MSATDPGGSTGKSLENFRLIERVSPSIWRAEDVRTGKTVAVKILSKGLPKDVPKREALVRDVRLNAALYHSFIVGIQEVAVSGDNLLLVMEWLDAKPLASIVRGHPLDRTQFFRVMYQIADAVKLLHAKNIVHGNIAGDSILVLPNGQAKLAGLNLGNILPRQGQPSQYQQKGNSVDAVGYMAPEQITGQQVTPQTDIFALGVVMFEAATGRLPYVAAAAAELAHKIVDEQPPSPKSINPNVDNAVLGVMGGCLFKDVFKRFKDAKLLLDSINRVEPGVAKFASDIAKAAAAPPPGSQQAAQARSSIIFAADVANYEELRATNPAVAEKFAARMQQILGEAVYLFDGKVLDPFGPRMIAELPSLDAAVEAGRKGEFDFSQDQQEGEVIPIRMLLHSGEVVARDGGVGGTGVAKAVEVLSTLPPLTLHVTEAFARRGKLPVRLRDAGARAGVKLATIVPPEPKPETLTEIDTQAEEAAAAAERAAVEGAARAAKKKQSRLMGIAAAIALVVIAGAAFFFMSNKKEAPAASAPTAAAPVAAQEPRKVLVSVTGTDPTLVDRANAVRAAVVEIMRTFPEVIVADASGSDVVSFNAEMRLGATTPEIVVEGAPSPAPDNASAIQPLLQSIAARLRLPDRGAANAEAYNAYADAVTANAAKDVAKTDAALRIATKADPNFTPAQLLAMKFFTENGKQLDALEAAKYVLTAQPNNIDAARLVARMSLGAGDLASAFRGYAALIRLNPKDTEALNTIAKYAVSVADAPKVAAALRRLAATPMEAEVHEPDLLLASGKIDAAVDKYYAIEEQVPNNAALSLKIGRIAVLRHSVPIAELELKKLQESDPLYGSHILKAYLAASAGNKAAAADELKAALAASTPGDDYWTTVAEVAAINGDANGVLDALERAASRKEPTSSYILNDPLFTFLRSEARFQKIRQSLLAQQNEIRTSLATVSL